MRHYHDHSKDQHFYYHETYIECITKMIEKMGSKYDQLLKSSPHSPIDAAIPDLLNIDLPSDYNFTHICDFTAVLRAINERLPSQRHKITFLL